MFFTFSLDSDRFAPPGYFRVRRIPVYDVEDEPRTTVGDYPTLELALQAQERLQREEIQSRGGRRVYTLFAVYDEHGVLQERHTEIPIIRALKTMMNNLFS